jgi:hypothetical protein
MWVNIYYIIFNKFTKRRFRLDICNIYNVWFVVLLSCLTFRQKGKSNVKSIHF